MRRRIRPLLECADSAGAGVPAVHLPGLCHRVLGVAPDAGQPMSCKHRDVQRFHLQSDDISVLLPACQMTNRSCRNLTRSLTFCGSDFMFVSCRAMTNTTWPWMCTRAATTRTPLSTSSSSSSPSGSSSPTSSPSRSSSPLRSSNLCWCAPVLGYCWHWKLHELAACLHACNHAAVAGQAYITPCGG